jgi:hypothetical protein
MRLLPLSIAALLIGLSPAHAQDRPLYNSSGGGGSTLYSSGGKPLSLKQITDGRSTSGYSYSRSGTGFSPYDGSGGGSYPTAAEVAAFRDRRAAEAQSAEQKALASLAQGHNAQPDPLATPAAVFAGQQQGTPAAGLGGAAQQPVKKRQRFEGRDTGVTIPPKVFNSVR